MKLSTRWMLALLLAWPADVFAGQVVGSAAQAAAPQVGDPFSLASLGQFVFGLLVVVGMIFALAWMLHRMNRIQGGVQGRMRILAGLPLGSRERVVLVQVGDEQILLGVAPGRVSRLHVLEHPLETKSVEPENDESFRKRLAAAMQRRRPQ
ncbi:MAG: flagellar biosynthetic protein FliO [Acidihalobacter sp.]|uniref:flagellar biosynthetic protein FliO n=1 Tax=Acidihalobacter sp. TaxID=1872108 RepID=UPI00307FCD20